MQTVDAATLREKLTGIFGAFSDPRPSLNIFGDVAGLMRNWTVHATHPRCFGLFNPSVLPVAAAADALAATFNPQLAVWSMAPAANEIERHVLRFLTARLGLDPDTTMANFCTGGAEANLSAVLGALSRAFPRWAEEGLSALPSPVGIYLSAESHDSLTKVARMVGLGRGVLRYVPVDESFRMDPDTLLKRIRRDRARGRHPLMVVGTAGTTGAGAIDPLATLADLAAGAGAWFHVDAAYGGIAALSDRLSPTLAGIEGADSVTWDAHKTLPIPMGAGMFFCRHPEAIHRAFSVRSSYAPGSVRDTVDPYTTTAQWSRRFIGLKVFAVFAELGAAGVADQVDRQAHLADLLRNLLEEHGFRVVNDTPLPVVCFTHPRIAAGEITAHAVAKAVRATGEAWISPVRLGAEPIEALRACITSHRTEERDLRALLDLLGRSLGP